ncbi:immune inhibitor A domain-containing protein [Grimontia sp. SpTr1]|uniref:immune inhibitor A domain-containing protein n=1 Tax=Grimontia sp. SpTr1 TaxID=2995319 RepID=UPI00248B805E|nr:immune inhibitor A domain-containing protein [Grimontia sp. SpTr1]
MNNVKATSLLLLVSIAMAYQAHGQTPSDRAIVNEEKIIEYLRRTGVINNHSTKNEIERALSEYLNRSEPKDDGVFSKKSLELKHDVLARKESLSAPDQNKRALFSLLATSQRTDKVLGILIDFPDLPFDDNQLTPDLTDMYYESYPASHYQNLLFGDSYEGPDGNPLITMKAYYEKESGGSYSVDGLVAGWYRAKNPAAFYGARTDSGGSDINARALVMEALDALAKDPSINLADFDKEDRYDQDGDGDFFEPDGLIDHLMIFHSSVGEEAGGGAIGTDAIWSHRWSLSSVYELEGTDSGLGYWNGKYAAYDYTMQPIDAAAGVTAHEYAHDLGLPDEYDTRYSGRGEPVSAWSIMSSGSWAGKIPGSEPVAFSAWAKEFLFAKMGGSWLSPETYSLEDLAGNTKTVRLAETTENNDGTNHVRINLPGKRIPEIPPKQGQYQYYSGKGDDLHTSMSADISLPDAASIVLTFDSHYDVEPNYDFARVLIDGKAIPGNITTYEDPLGSGLVPAVHSYSKDHPDNVDGWVPATFDLSQFAGKDVTLTFEYITDGGWIEQGFYADNIQIIADGSALFSDDAEGESAFSLNGYTLNDGFGIYDHYYMLQWRSYADVDQGLKHLNRYGKVWQYEPGLVIWYADDSYSDNWVGQHPGYGWLGVVDADQSAVTWSKTGNAASTHYQIHDATFSLQDQFAGIDVSGEDVGSLIDDALNANAHFSDRNDYSNADQPDAGRNIPEYGLMISVVEQAEDNQFGIIEISLDDVAPLAGFEFEVDGYQVSFINQSTDREGPITAWFWDYGDGNTSNQTNPVHVYTQGGDYTVSLTVTDQFGQTHTITKTISLNLAPKADYDVLQFHKWALFISRSTDKDGSIKQHHWDFGDGTSFDTRNSIILHKYRKRGTYQTSLKVTDNDGASDRTEMTVTVKKISKGW